MPGDVWKCPSCGAKNKKYSLQKAAGGEALPGSGPAFEYPDGCPQCGAPIDGKAIHRGDYDYAPWTPHDKWWQVGAAVWAVVWFLAGVPWVTQVFAIRPFYGMLAAIVWLLVAAIPVLLWFVVQITLGRPKKRPDIHLEVNNHDGHDDAHGPGDV